VLVLHGADFPRRRSRLIWIWFCALSLSDKNRRSRANQAFYTSVDIRATGGSDRFAGYSVLWSRTSRWARLGISVLGPGGWCNYRLGGSGCGEGETARGSLPDAEGLYVPLQTFVSLTLSHSEVSRRMERPNPSTCAVRREPDTSSYQKRSSDGTGGRAGA
jgi:hypothetical protein